MRRSILLATLVVGLPFLAACGTTSELAANCAGQTQQARAARPCGPVLAHNLRMGERQQRNSAVDHSLSKGL